MLDIAFVSTYEEECGIATYTADLVAALRKLNHRVSVLAELNSKGFKDPQAYPLWRRGTEYNSMHGLSAIAKAIAQAPKKPDVLHIQHEFGLYPTNPDFERLLGSFRNTAPEMRIVFTLHTVLTSPYRSEFFRTIRDQPHVIVHTHGAAAALTDWGIRATVIPHGTWLQSQAQTPRTKLSLPENVFLALCPGFISAGKGHEMILKALAHVDGAHLLVTGLCRDDSYFNKLAQWLDVYGLRSRVHLRPGFQNAATMRAYYQTADVVILGAKPKEETPYSASGQAATALGYGKPVLAKNANIYRESGALLYASALELKNLLAYTMRPATHALLSAKARHLAEMWNWDSAAQAHLTAYGANSNA